MGWCSGTEIFDEVCKLLLSDKPIDVKQAIKQLILVLEDHDWDCESDSDFYDHPIVQSIFKEMHPDWFE